VSGGRGGTCRRCGAPTHRPGACCRDCLPILHPGGRPPERVGCAAEGCDQPHHARGWCRPHYQQYWAAPALDPEVCGGCGLPTLPAHRRPSGWACPHCARFAALDERNYGSVPVDCVDCADIAWLRGYGGLTWEEIDARMRRRSSWAQRTWERHHDTDGNHIELRGWGGA